MQDSVQRFLRSEETCIILDLLRECADKPRPNTVSYAEISDAVGFTVTGVTHNLRTAREILLREDGVITSCVLRTGVRIEDATGGADVVDFGRKGIRRKARRTRIIASNVEFAELSPDKKIQMLTNQSYVALVEGVGREKRIKQLQAKLENRTKALNYTEMVLALRDRTSKS